MSRSRNWCFTLNNYTDDDRVRIGERLAVDAVYVCYQPERGENGTPHLQGAVVFKNPRELGGVKRLISPRAHLEVMRGTVAESITYCSKDETRDAAAGFGFTEHGTKPDGPGQGARTDLATIGKRLREGETLTVIAEDYPADFVRYHQGLKALQAIYQCRPRVRQPDGTYGPLRVKWYYGCAGGGKTRTVMDEIGTQRYYRKMPGNKWFDGYAGEKIIIFDDLRDSQFPFGILLSLLDIYPLMVEVKGGSCHYAPEEIYITAPRHPRDYYAGLEAATEGSIQQLLRRIHEIRLFGPEPPAPAARVEGFRAA